MNSNIREPLVWLVLIFLQVSLLGAHADPVRSQTIQLKEGWNAVYLEVYPPDSDPSVLFQGTPIDVAAAYFEASLKAQFITDPGTGLFKQAGWQTWYADERPDAFLKTLSTIYGQQGYLIHATSDYTLTLSGQVIPQKVRWQPDSYQLVGFSVDALAPPTFDQFFSGSKAHRHNHIFRLKDGVWKQLLNTEAEAMRSGEAFWIFSEGASQYQGPLQVDIPTRHGLFLGDKGNKLILRNQTDFPIEATVSQVAEGNDPLPLSIMIQMIGDKTDPIRSVAAPKPSESWAQSLPALEAGQSIQVPLEVRQEEMANSVQSSVIKITTDMGTEIWLPVVGIRKDLEEN